MAVLGSADGTWEIVRIRPHPGLRSLVHHYQGIRYSTARPRVRLELPHDAVTLFLSFGDPLEVWRPTAGGAAGDRWTSLLAGLRTEPAFGRYQGTVHGVEISMAPWGAFALLGIDMAEAARADIDASDLPGPRWDRLVERLAETPDWPARFALLDRALLRQAADGPAWAPETVHSWRRLSASCCCLAVPDLAAEVGWSPRRLGNVFRHQLGLTPKAAARVMRLQHVLRLLLDGTPQALAAAECGFYDQAHLALDFKHMTSRTPGEFLAAAACPPWCPYGIAARAE
jgi:AraC-like DNA-binding protein